LTGIRARYFSGSFVVVHAVMPRKERLKRVATENWQKRLQNVWS